MKTKYTFQNQRYITSGVKREIYSEIQLLLWMFIDNQVEAGLKMDYLQIFTFIKKDNKLIIKQVQEKPRRTTDYEALWFPEYQSLLGQKVYIISEEDIETASATMLLSNEY